MKYKAERKIIAGKLKFSAGFHIGTGDADDWIDSTIVKTKDDKPFIPGTTLAGIFRNLAEEHISDKKSISGLFGSTDNNGSASRIIFCDSFSTGTPELWYRNGVGIKRDTLTARDKALFSLEIASRSEFDFRIIIDNPQEEDMNIIAPILAEMQSGRVVIGGDKSRGLGWATLSDLKHADIKLDATEIDEFINYLVENKMSFQELKVDNLAKTGDGIDANHIAIEYTLSLDDIDASLIVSSGIPGFSKDADNTVMRDGMKGEFFIPGSSIKGPIRAQAEKILRYLNKNACDPTDRDKSCSAKISKVKKGNNIDCSKKDIVEKYSCPICKIFGNGYLASKIFFTDAYETNEQKSQVIENVAIDRFTGGGLEGAKFNTEVATKVNLKGRIILKKLTQEQTALIAFTLRDWLEGDIRLGFGKMKGYGRCKIQLDKINLCAKDDNWLKKRIEDGWGKKGFYNTKVIDNTQFSGYMGKIGQLKLEVAQL